ncbi:hypothetical protein SCUP515_08232 [Seiridium cupressi]
MSSSNISDDWVADLLSQEAADCALKYSTMGMDAYTKPAKRPESHPKPNTRFLTNIVKATNSHNRNLLEQERADSRARLKDLERTKQEADERERRRRPGTADTRKRMLGDIKAIIGGSSKKRKTDDGDRGKDVEDDSKRLRRDDGDTRSRGRGHLRDEERDREDVDGKSRNSRKELFVDHGPKRGSTREHRNEERTRSRERRHRSDRHGDRHRHADEGTRDRGPREVRKDHDLFESRSKEHHSHDSDSDPLEDIIGPKPPPAVRKRGRGAVSGTSAMDSRFESGYDPKGDVALDHDEEDDDWGSALEALRDRQRWKEQGADRLRAAGFTDEQVKKWENGDQKNEEDVRWTKKGEQREWDRGKTVKDGI